MQIINKTRQAALPQQRKTCFRSQVQGLSSVLTESNVVRMCQSVNILTRHEIVSATCATCGSIGEKHDDTSFNNSSSINIFEGVNWRGSRSAPARAKRRGGKGRGVDGRGAAQHVAAAHSR